MRLLSERQNVSSLMSTEVLGLFERAGTESWQSKYGDNEWRTVEKRS